MDAEEGDLRRPRATSGAARNENPTSPTGSSRFRDDAISPRGDAISPREGAVSPRGRASDSFEDGGGLRRRSSARSRGSRGIPSLAPRTTLAARTQGKFTMAGPEETPQLRMAQEPFVQPGYGDLNPSYEQPANAKPVWSLAKPLPRVVRPGMVPTKQELLELRANAQLPAENSQRYGLDVDPNDLEEGRIAKTTDPRKMAAQVEDARLQREQAFMDKILSGEAQSTRLGSSRRMSRTSSTRRRRRSRWNNDQDALSAVEEGDSQTTEDAPEGNDYFANNPMNDIPEQEEPPLDEDADEKVQIPIFDDEDHPEDLHPLIEELVEDEIHNNHTTWSVIRTHHREALAEALGVFVQLTVGFCADLSVTINDQGNPNTTAWAWGFATMMGIYISGGVSGAHFNPVVTIMLWFYRGFPKSKMPEYFAAQFLGAFCAALAAYGVYYESIQHYLQSNAESGIMNSFITSQRETWIGAGTAFGNEFLGTVMLSCTILALGDDQNAPPGAGMNSFIVGLVVTCLSMVFAYQTGAAFNPSRDFGPRLALLALGYPGEMFRNAYWFYGPWVGALSGAMGGAFLYDFFIFTGGESPVNYPWERTQRAMRKSRMKWGRRLHISKKEKEENDATKV